MSVSNQDESPELQAYREQLAWKEIDQYHSVVLTFATKCMELKKLCGALLAAELAFSGAVLGKSGTEGFSRPALVIALFTIFIFWIVDAQFYGFQRKMRLQIASATERIRRVHRIDIPSSSLKGIEVPPADTLRQSLFNPSQWVYFVFAAIVAVLWVSIPGTW